MAKGVNQKLKLLYLMDILLEKTDENHGITMNEIISSLESYDVSAERKSIGISKNCSGMAWMFSLTITGERRTIMSPPVCLKLRN